MSLNSFMKQHQALRREKKEAASRRCSEYFEKNQVALFRHNKRSGSKSLAVE
ncbi:hypothetical protein VST7929_01605 [Vibrio stylophorae]|uniref:Uncharacterized protein n=1 Tax=Vibrio stylophorae TaxID=659351 RepID=A0ABM8ZTT4_9VIBR|nr:hypothetical protein VST7929_01605 [Vibrio stylophorae]